jgi:hypothetical protein
MTDTKKPAAKAVPPKKTGLELMREPFPEHQVSKLPKGTKAQNDCPPAEKINCKVCGGWHHPKVVHLDYVGHAALTDRLLDCDPAWDWQPVSFNADGSPTTDKDGGMWIRLTVCGVTRLGYGDAPQKMEARQQKSASAMPYAMPQCVLARLSIYGIRANCTRKNLTTQ